MPPRRARAGVDNSYAQKHKGDSYGGYEEPAPVVDPFGRSPRRLVGVSVARAVVVQQCGLTLPARPVHTAHPTSVAVRRKVTFAGAAAGRWSRKLPVAGRPKCRHERHHHRACPSRPKLRPAPFDDVRPLGGNVSIDVPAW